jgi:hypothetical protein
MKLITLIALLTFSIPAFSRQYIQCGARDSFNGAVINLDGENSSLFMTNGVHLPDEDRSELLKELVFHSEDSQFQNHITTGDSPIMVSIPQSVIGKYSRSFTVLFSNSNGVMYCFSAIYND